MSTKVRLSVTKKVRTMKKPESFSSSFRLSFWWSLALHVVSLLFFFEATPVDSVFVSGDYFLGPKSTASTGLGTSTAISRDGQTIVSGGTVYNGAVGAAFVFSRSPSGKFLPEIFYPPEYGVILAGSGYVGTPRQGSSVAISGDGNIVVSGGPNDNNSVGAVWIFKRTGSTWAQQGSKLVGSDAVAPSEQGRIITTSDDGLTVAVGAKRDNNFTGAYYIFEYNPQSGTWVQQGPKVTGSLSSLALSADGNTLAIGRSALSEIAIATRDSQGQWSIYAPVITANDGVGSNPRLGIMLKFTYAADILLAGGKEQAWVFRLVDGVWTQQGSRIAVDDSIGGTPLFGDNVAISSDGALIVISGSFDNVGVGAVWVFERSIPDYTWVRQGPKLLPNPDFKRNYGYSLDLSGDGETLVIGHNSPPEVGITILYKLTSAPTPSPTTSRPSFSPSYSPTTSRPSISPSISPSKSPTTSSPSTSPSLAPTTSRPSFGPSHSPTTSKPSRSPSRTPSNTPTTPLPSTSPSKTPSSSPSEAPSEAPSTSPKSSSSHSVHFSGCLRISSVLGFIILLVLTL